MFQLSKEEFLFWKSQIVTSKVDRKGLRRPPYAFTEQGVAMLRSQGVRSQGISVILEGPQREFFAVGQFMTLICVNYAGFKIHFQQIHRSFKKKTLSLQTEDY